MRFLLICLGGAFGTGARYGVQILAVRWMGSSFPYGTLAVNVLGSILIGLVNEVAFTTSLIPPTVRVMLTIGVMGGLSIWHWLIVGAVMLLVFGGKGKISDIMGDVAKGIKSFKKGLAEEDQKPELERPGDPPMRTIDHQTAADADKIPDTRKLG